MSVLDEHVLTLNKSWAPIDTITVKAAFGRMFAGTVQALNTDDYTLHGIESWLDVPVSDNDFALRTGRLSIRVPEVIVCIEPAHVPERRKMQYGRRNLLKRDRGTCQYCGKRPGPSGLTVDHIHPSSKGGPGAWTNCVMACLDCNQKKGDKTLAQIDMKLRVRPEMKLAHPNEPHLWTAPYEPVWTPIYHLGKSKFRESWKKFLTEKMIEQHNMMAG